MDSELRTELAHMISENVRVLTNALEASDRHNSNFQDSIGQLTTALLARTAPQSSEGDGTRVTSASGDQPDVAMTEAQTGTTSGLVRVPAAVYHLQEKDPHFPEWDGDRNKLLLW